MLAQDILGTATLVTGFPCTPTSPASLGVQVGPGRLYSVQSVDSTAYSTIAADTTDQILKQGIQLGSASLVTPAPMTSGFSVNYLIEAGYSDTDATPLVLSYYNVNNPQQALSGPSNSGTAQNTQRLGQVTFSVKSGIPAITGSQTTPAPDSGVVGLYVVTVAYGQTSVTAASITPYAGANFLSSTLSSLNSAIAAEIAARTSAVSSAISSANSYATSYANGVSATAQAAAISAATALLQSYITSLKLYFNASPQFYKIATLPVSNASTCDSVNIRGTFNSGWQSYESAMFDIVAGNRGGFSVIWNAFGPIGAVGCIQMFRETDGSVSVYAAGSEFSYAFLSILNVGGGATSYSNSAAITTPTGTLVFTTQRPDLYPPLLNVASSSTYSTAAQIAAAYVANGTLATAISGLQAYANTAAGNALSTAETFANNAAAAAQGTAISAAEGYASSVASSAQSAAQAYALSLLNAIRAGSSTLGSFTIGTMIVNFGKATMGSDPATITFQTAFTNACCAIVPVGIEVGASGIPILSTSDPASSKSSFQVSSSITSGTSFCWIAIGY